MASIGIQSAKLPHHSRLPATRSTRVFSSIKFPQQVASASNQGVSSPNRVLAPLDPENPHGMIDSMMHASAADIVKNLKQAPLLVQIYAENGGIKIHTEKAVQKDWPLVEENFRDGSKSPDGLIYVEELGQEEEGLGEDGVSRAWGVIFQKKEGKRGPACYLLKTNRVCGGFGLGFCTHFCLMRVNNFRDSAFEQFKDSWLVR